MTTLSNVTYNFTGCKFVVTGASSGIGRQITLELAKANAFILAIARRSECLKSLADEYPKNIIIAHTDGDLPGVQNDCGIVYAKEKYILAIMTDGSIDKGKTLKTINQISSIIYNSVVDREVFQK